MKYLAKELEGRDFITCSYFFDFRQKDSLINSEEGFLRSILTQLLDRLPDLCNKLEVTLNPGTLDVEVLRECFGKILNHHNSNFVILVDGMDEFSGNIRSMIAFLLNFTPFANLKLCLASRLEPMIQQLLQSLPKINAASYNKHGITTYVRSTFAEFQPFMDNVELLQLQGAILSRADGVFLWVSFAIEEVLQACVGGAVEEEILEKLDQLSTDLEVIYQRILDRIPDSRKVEAALILTLLAKPDAPEGLDVLFQGTRFVARTLNIATTVIQIKNVDQFEKRMQATLGGMVESYKAEHYNKYDISSSQTVVQVVHETVRSFLRQTRWAEQILPSAFLNEYPNVIWSRLCTNALITYDRGLYHNRFGSAISDRIWQNAIEHDKQHIDYINVQPLLRRSFERCQVSEAIIDSVPLIILAIRDIFLSIQDIESVASEPLDWTPLLTLRLSGLHYASTTEHMLLISCQQNLPLSFLTSPIMHFMLAAGHGHFAYLKTHLHDMIALRDAQRNDIVAALLSYPRQLRRSHQGICYRYLPLDNHNINQELKAVRELVNEVFMLNRAYSSYHLAVFVLLAYDYVPSYLQTLQTTAETIPWPKTQRPKWSVDGLLPPWALEPPLFIWACDNGYYPTRSECDCLSLLALLSCGVDIHSRASFGHNIVQYIVDIHIITHFFALEHDVEDNSCGAEGDISRSVTKIYMLEELGADFEPNNGHPTPLQMCRQYSGRLAPAPDFVPPTGDSVTFPELNTPKSQHDLLTSILKHKHHTGHLPRAYQLQRHPSPSEVIYPWYPSSFDHSEAAERPGKCYLCSFVTPKSASVSIPEIHINNQLVKDSQAGYGIDLYVGINSHNKSLLILDFLEQHDTALESDEQTGETWMPIVIDHNYWNQQGTSEVEWLNSRPTELQDVRLRRGSINMPSHSLYASDMPPELVAELENAFKGFTMVDEAAVERQFVTREKELVEDTNDQYKLDSDVLWYDRPVNESGSVDHNEDESAAQSQLVDSEGEAKVGESDENDFEDAVEQQDDS